MSETQKPQPPHTLLEAIRYFADLDVATEFVASLRWPEGWHCPDCGHGEFSYLTTRRLWKCKSCKRQTSVKVGTIFEDSPLGLDKWLPAVWLIANSKNGISSHELARALGITQKSSWFMLHRIRLAMQTGSFERFDGTVEADETYIGGLAKNMHKRDRKRKISGTGGADKTAVFGVRERESGTVKATVIGKSARIAKVTLEDLVSEHVEKGSTLYTDTASGYRDMDLRYDHDTVIHSAGEYVDGVIHTNGIENFWALLKRGLHGTYVQVAPEHLFRYVEERVFTYNKRTLSDLGRFSEVLTMAVGRRLTWDELTVKVD